MLHWQQCCLLPVSLRGHVLRYLGNSLAKVMCFLKYRLLFFNNTHTSLTCSIMPIYFLSCPETDSKGSGCTRSTQGMFAVQPSPWGSITGHCKGAGHPSVPDKTWIFLFADPAFPTQLTSDPTSQMQLK